MHVRRVILLLTGETTARAAPLPRQLLLRTAGRLVLLVYSRAPPPLEPPPTNGLCNNGLCVGHASVHSDRGPRAWGSGGCARARVVLNSSSTGPCTLC